jgi:hypothetical protein
VPNSNASTLSVIDAERDESGRFVVGHAPLPGAGRRNAA